MWTWNLIFVGLALSVFFDWHRGLRTRGCTTRPRNAFTEVVREAMTTCRPGRGHRRAVKDAQSDESFSVRSRKPATAEVKASLSSPATMWPVPETSTASACGTTSRNSSTDFCDVTSD